MRRLLWLLTFLIVAQRPSFAVPACDDAPLTHGTLNVGRLFPGKLATVSVEVVDRRPWEHLLAGGLLGPGSDKGKGLYYPYLSQIPHEVATFARDAAKEAVFALGLDEGPRATLEIIIHEFQIDLRRGSGFSPMNCVGYGRLETRLVGENGQVLRTGAHRLTYFEWTLPVALMNEVAEKALSRIYQQAAWEVTVKELLAQYPQSAIPEEIGRLLASFETTKKSEDQRGILFWLALAGSGNSSVFETMERLFRTSKDGRVAEGAAEALGMLGASGMREEIEAILSGSKRLPNWEPDDVTMNWYLLKALHLLGRSDLTIPEGKMRYRSLLDDLVGFLKSGSIRPPSEREVQGLEKAREELEEEMAKEQKKATKKS